MSPMPPTDPIIDFEWNVFEQQFLEWQHITPEILSPDQIEFSSNAPRRPSSAVDPERSPSPSSPEIDGVDLDVSASLSKQSSTAYFRRRNQNRVSQRAFRARQRHHVAAVEEKLKSVLSEYEQLQQRYTALSIDYQSLVEEKGISDMSAVHDWFWYPESIGGFDREGSRNYLGSAGFEGLNSGDGGFDIVC